MKGRCDCGIVRQGDNPIIIIKNVPALVCSQCGEVYYNDEISEKLEEIMNRLQALVKDVAIFEYDKVVNVAPRWEFLKQW